MAQKNKGDGFTLDLDLATDVEGELHGYLFDSAGNLVERQAVEKDTLELESGPEEVQRGRLFIGPAPPPEAGLPEEKEPDLGLMRRLEAYEPILREGPRGSLREKIRIPEDPILEWNLCFCWIRGRVRQEISTDGKTLEGPVCGARVHICEVDSLPRWIIQLPDSDLLQLRDDLWQWIDQPELPEPPQPAPRPDLDREFAFLEPERPAALLSDSP